MNYNRQDGFYCGVDLHARSMFTHVLDHKGKTVFEEDLPADPDAIKPFCKNVVVGCECMFAWYWLADLCEDKKSSSSSATLWPSGARRTGMDKRIHNPTAIGPRGKYATNQHMYFCRIVATELGSG